MQHRPHLYVCVSTSLRIFSYAFDIFRASVPLYRQRQEFVEAVGRPFIDGGHVNDETVGYIVSGATVHINRHVREASFQIIR